MGSTLLTSIQLELPGVSPNDTLQAACAWLQASLECEYWTRRMHADHCRYLLAYFRDAKVNDIGYALMMEYVRSEQRRGLSKESVRKRLSTLKMALREAVAHGTLERLPDFPVLKSPAHPKQGYWTKLQWEAVHLGCDADEDFRTWVDCNWWLGMHPSDLDRFRWQDVDLVKRTWIRRNTKVHAKPAELPLPDRLWEILAERRESLLPHPRDLVCGHRMGNCNRELRELAERAGVPSICPMEAGRHSAETYLNEKGASLLFQQTWLGLKSMAMLRFYRHMTDEGLAAGARAMNG